MCPQVQGLVQENKANLTSGKHVRSYSTFDKSLSYRLYNTLRFGEYTPSFVMEGVETDEISLNSVDRIDSLSLKAPFKGSIRKIKESFMVPNMAILPLNWDRIYTQPSHGDDVPLNANCVLLNFPSNFKTFWLDMMSVLNSNLLTSSSLYHDVGKFLTAMMRALIVGEYYYSNGSLLNVCGYKASPQFYYQNGPRLDYDQFFDKVVSTLFRDVVYFEIQIPVGNSVQTRYFWGLAGNPSSGLKVESFHSFLELMRENPLCNFTIDVSGSNFPLTGSTTLAQYLAFIIPHITAFTNSNNYHFCLPPSSNNELDQNDLTSLNPNTLNLSRLLAYQLVCAHFYSNSAVDFMYTAELYRQYIFYLEEVVADNAGSLSTSYTHFTWNGEKCPYDYLSGRMLSIMTQNISGSSFLFTYAQLSGVADVTNNRPLYRLSLFPAVFGFRKSLRYGDYFVGSRPRPLAPINTDVAVNSNMVSVIDITRRIQAQRFANAVMRSRSKIENYVKSLFGREPAPDYHNPFFLTRQEEIIYGDEVQNTAASQITDPNSRTSNFANNVGAHTFTFHNDDMHPCIYLQIISFDIRRAYTRSVERQFLHVDRFDMFNPDFQFIGDQPIYGIELGYIDSTDSIPSVFAYQNRDMEYKQRFDQACGGFVKNLPGWILTDIHRDHMENPVLDPDFIRSYNAELDQFFLSVTGFSLGSYFHFICMTDNNVNAKRPMVVDPQILA